MNRETKTHQTPSGKEVVMKTYMTARERNELRHVLLHDAKLDMQSNGIKDVAADSLEAAEKKFIEIMVTSYDGSSEKILDRLLDGRPDDYDFVVKQAQEASNEDFSKAK